MAANQAAAAAYQRKQAMVKPSKGGRGIPPPGEVYTFEFIEIVSYTLGKAFEGKDPEYQFTLKFLILDYDDPDTGEPMEVTGWYTNKPEVVPNYPESKLYKLMRAMNGGIPWTPPVDDKGNVLEYNTWDVLEADFVGKTFRAQTTLTDKGWCRVSNDPMPLRAKRPQPIKATVVEEVDEETGEILDSGAIDDFA